MRGPPSPEIVAAADPPPTSSVAGAKPADAEANPKIIAGADAPTACLPPGLKSALAAVAARFGPVTVVSSNRLNTDNHSSGSVRYNLHLACKAVDFKVQGNVKEVMDFLRTRPEVAGINTYRNNGIIHIDANESAAVAGRRARPSQVQED